MMKREVTMKIRIMFITIFLVKCYVLRVIFYGNIYRTFLAAMLLCYANISSLVHLLIYA